MKYIKLFLSKLFDYSLLYSILYAIGMQLDIIRENLLIGSLVLLVPLLWIPLKKCFKTTPGQFLFNSNKYLMVLGVILMSVFCSAKIINHRLHKHSSLPVTHSEQYGGWTLTEDDAFKAYFPHAPELTESALPIPGDTTLPLIEHKAENDQTYSIAYTVLPQKWLSYSDSTILKHSLKEMANAMPDTTIKYKVFADHGPYQAIDYTLISEGKDILGRMILVQDHLYKVEIKHDAEHKAELQETMNRFIQSFYPKTA